VTTAAKDILRTVSWPALALLWIVTMVVTAVLVRWDPPDAVTSLVVGALGAWTILGIVVAFPRRMSARGMGRRSTGGPGDCGSDPDAHGWPEAGRE
jgi:hypothetical protein